MMNAYSKTTGKRIVGTSELTPGTAGICSGSFQLVEGALDFEYDGDTDMDWDGQETVERDGQRVFVDADGTEVLESDIELRWP